MWDDALSANKQWWERFCAPFRNGLQGSMMLVTTRSSQVAHGVGTVEHFTLDGLKDDVFWDFFKLCAFGSLSSNNDPELEQIGRSILPKLKGSPLAAQTLGRLLSTSFQTSYWNSILNSELWGLPQEISDILPALQLSYIYLPFHLKRCFSFCAVYPKDYKFEKSILSEIWVAEGFVKREGDIPIVDTGCQYFEDLVSRSFFQKVRGTYVIHDLMHDMAQLVSKHECFTIEDLSDFQKVPRNVRHLMILDSRNFDCSNLLSLCEHTKLRTLLCEKSLISNITLASVMNRWCSELRHIRVFSCASLKEIPISIGNLKHLRYLRISKRCPFNCLPPEICWLCNLQFLYATKCEIESLPTDFSKLINLQIYESMGFVYNRMKKLELVGDINLYPSTAGCNTNVRLMKNMNQFFGDFEIDYLQGLSEDLAAEIDLKNKKDLGRLTLKWYDSQEHSKIVFQLLQPPTNLKYLKVFGYGGEYFPCWYNNSTISVFPSLTDLEISYCKNLSSLDHFLQVDYMPALQRISITDCEKVAPLPAERKPVSANLKKLELHNSGIIVSNIECCSLTSLSFKCVHVTAIPIQLLSGNLPSLQKLNIIECESLTFIGESYPLNGAFSFLTVLIIEHCHRLPTLDGLLKKEHLPAIEIINIYSCTGLLSLPGERFGSFTCLSDLRISHCPNINWQSGLVLPSYLKRLSLNNCGNFSAWFPNCLGSLTCLVELTMIKCHVSIGAVKPISKIKTVYIYGCQKLTAVKQPFTRRGRYLGTCNPNHQFPSIQRVRRNRTGGTAHVIV
uniref:Uncharacterized protein n=1 Tax=Oryza glumipatula TaxID=40148 RepID=A0A0D9YQH9_9ORYZ